MANILGPINPRLLNTQPSAPWHPRLQHATLVKNASAYSTSTCLSHSNMPKSPVRLEIIDPEAQICVVERFLRDLFNTPGHGSVCAGGRHKIGPRFLSRVCFYGNRPLEPTFSTQKLIFFLSAGFCEMCLTYQAMWAGVPPPKNRCWSSQKQAKVGGKHPKMCNLPFSNLPLRKA